jgi:hypothetical protein
MVFAHQTEFSRKVGYNVSIKRGEDGSMALGLKNYGKLKIIFTRKARAMTAANTLNADGGLWKSFKTRAVKYLTGFKTYFKKQSHYADTDENLIDSFKTKK